MNIEDMIENEYQIALTREKGEPRILGLGGLNFWKLSTTLGLHMEEEKEVPMTFVYRGWYVVRVESDSDLVVFV